MVDMYQRPWLLVTSRKRTGRKDQAAWPSWSRRFDIYRRHWLLVISRERKGRND